MPHCIMNFLWGVGARSPQVNASPQFLPSLIFYILCCTSGILWSPVYNSLLLKAAFKLVQSADYPTVEAFMKKFRVSLLLDTKLYWRVPNHEGFLVIWGLKVLEYVQSFLKDLKKSTCLSKMSQDIFFHKHENLVGNRWLFLVNILEVLILNIIILLLFCQLWKRLNTMLWALKWLVV